MFFPRFLLALAACASLAFSSACGGRAPLSSGEVPPPEPSARPPDEEGAEAAPEVAEKAEPEPPPEPETLLLEVPGFLPAVVVTPSRPGPRPVLVATHGAGGQPEWDCAFWGEVAAGRAFVLCPRGKPFGRGGGSLESQAYFYPEHHSLAREIEAGLAALEARFGEAAGPGPHLYAGFSQGASFGALVVWQKAVPFSGAVLMEGGFSEWNVAAAKKFRAKGGRRVVFACGQGGCHAKAKKMAEYLERGGVGARVEFDPEAGHGLSADLARKVRASFEWLVEGDPRWAP